MLLLTISITNAVTSIALNKLKIESHWLHEHVPTVWTACVNVFITKLDANASFVASHHNRWDVSKFSVCFTKSI